MPGIPAFEKDGSEAQRRGVEGLFRAAVVRKAIAYFFS